MAGQLSGGLKRRLMIARALMHSPHVLILDEPTVGLDTQTRRRIWELIRKMNKDGMTVLLTTHYIEALPLPMPARPCGRLPWTKVFPPSTWWCCWGIPWFCLQKASGGSEDQMIADSKPTGRQPGFGGALPIAAYFFNSVADSQDITGYAMKQPGNLR